MFNPFYGVFKADEIRDEREIAELFVPSASAIWQEVQEPVNQLIVGPRGAGKTILLRQLHYPVAARRLSSDFCPYIGIYLQISRLSTTFRHLFPKEPAISGGTIPHPASPQSVFGDYLCFEILRQLVLAVERCLASVGQQLRPNELSEVCADVETFGTPSEVVKFCRAGQTSIEALISQGLAVLQRSGYAPTFDIGIFPARACSAVQDLCRGKTPESPNVYFVLDESCRIPQECQSVFNVLLQRGRPFKTKLAVRPYDWTTLETVLGVAVEEGVDFRLLPIEYPDELSAKYAEQMRAIANQVLRTRIVNRPSPPPGWPQIDSVGVDDIFVPPSAENRGYSGFDDICVASSGVPENLLSICSAIFCLANRNNKLADGVLPRIEPDLQSQELAGWSNDKEHSISDPGTRQFCRALLLNIDRSVQDSRSILFHVHTGEDDSLFRPRTLPEELGCYLKVGFAQGLLRGHSDGHTGLWEVPCDFSLTRALLPSRGLSLTTPALQPVAIDPQFVLSHVAERAGRTLAKEENELSGQTLNAFLSTSFSEMSLADIALVKDALKRVQIDCIVLPEVPQEQFLYTTVLREIGKNRFTVLNATALRPYTLFEVGLCAGLQKPKPVVGIFNDEDIPGKFDSLPDYVKKLTVATYSFSQERLSEMASKVRREAEHLLTRRSEFEFEESTGVRLRLQRRPRTGVYVAYPDDPIWEHVLPVLGNGLHSLGYRIVTDSDAGVYRANTLQVAIRAASLASIYIVDTSGEERPDLLQCFKLGVAYAMSKQKFPLRLERIGKDHKAVFDSLPGEYKTWSDIDQLKTVVVSFLRQLEPTTKKRKK